MKPILYNYFRSTASYRVRIALALKKIDFEYRAVNLLKGENREPEYLRLNPKGEVPYFIDGDFKLIQSLVICEYLDSKIQSSPLFPAKLRERLRVLEICEIIGAGIQPIQNLPVINELTKRFGADDDAKTKWQHFFLGRGFDALEPLLKESSGKYSVGDEPSAADCFLIPQVFSANRFKFDISKYPTVERITKTCIAEPAFAAAHPSKQPDFVA